MGGLGNQLFQIFATISYAIQTENNYKFTNTVMLFGGTRHTYWDSFLSELKSKTTDMFPAMTRIKEASFEYNDIDLNEIRGKNIMLSGYFQSYKYFEKNYNMICKIIMLTNKKLDVLLRTDYTSEILLNSISLHFRMGDYKTLQHIHPIMNYEYYKNALTYIETNLDNNASLHNKSLQVLYFCEDADVEEVKDIIHDLEIMFSRFTFVRCSDKLQDWEQMLIMSLCRHNIIANSTFSWWGAYLNENENKVVCYPQLWFGEESTHNTSDMFPPNWVKIKTIHAET
jgi:hypothetical protein